MGKIVIIMDDDGIEDEDREYLQRVFRGEISDKKACEYCGGLHQRECPRVKRIVFHPSGERPSEIEFWPDGQWDSKGIVWPEDVF